MVNLKRTALQRRKVLNQENELLAEVSIKTQHKVGQQVSHSLGSQSSSSKLGSQRRRSAVVVIRPGSGHGCLRKSASAAQSINSAASASSTAEHTRLTYTSRQTDTPPTPTASGRPSQVDGAYDTAGSSPHWHRLHLLLRCL